MAQDEIFSSSRQAPPDPVQVAVTFFADKFATTKREGVYGLDDLLAAIWNTGAAKKEKLPLLKLARFSDKPNDKHSLRYNANVTTVSGCEVDYDGAVVPFETAVRLLQESGILAIAYTSPSYQPNCSKWRLLLPFSQELPPDQRATMVARINGLFGGIFAAESFVLSQSYYYGSVAGNPHHRAVLIEGTPIDLHHELDATAKGKARGGDEGSGGSDGPVDEAGLMDQIRSGESYHPAAITLIGRWAFDGQPYATAAKRIQALFDATPEAGRDQRWKARRGELFRTLDWVYRREAAKPSAGPNGAAPSEAPTSLGGIAADLDRKDLPMPSWRVEGIIPEEGLTIFVGKPKTKKSWAALDIALACADGTMALGKYPTRLCDTIFLALEDNERRMQFRQRKLLAGTPAPENLIYGYECPAGMACLSTIAMWLDQNPTVRLVVIDPFARIRGTPDGRRNAFMQDYFDIGALANFASQRHIAVLLTHHARKQEASDPLDRINGTMAISAAADTIMVLTRTGTTTATLSITGKDIELDGDFALLWDPPSCRWSVLGEAAAVQRETAQDKIFNFLLAQQEPSSVAEIGDELGLKRATVRGTLNRLKGHGTVETVGRGKWQVRHD
jgi:biotin operon repressor